MKIKPKMLQMIVPRLKQRSDRYFSPFIIGYKKSKSFCSKDDSANNDIDDVKNETKVKNSKVNRKIIEAITADGSVDLQHIPIHILKKKSRIKNLHLVDKNAAEHFASLIASNLTKTNSTVIEVNPGTGYLTEKLLEAGVARLELYESEAEFSTGLAPLIAKYPDRLSLKMHDFFSFSKRIYPSSVGNRNVLGGICNHIEKREWVDEPSAYIVGPLIQRRFLYYLRYLLISGDLSDYGRVALYVAILPSTSLVFGDTRSMLLFHTPNNILLQVLFTYERLGTLPRRAFLPWPCDEKNKKKYIRYYKEDNELMHVAKLVPRPDCFTDDFTKHDAETFYYFLVLHLRPSSSRIISSFEKWIPGCGVRLIRMNINIFTKFNDLTALEMLNLFKAFKSWPEYKHTAFLSFVEDLKSRRFANSS